MRGLRIAYVINSVEGGGAALPVPSIIAVLRRAGAEVRLLALTRRDGRALPAIAAAGIDAIVRPGGEADHAAALAWLDAQVRDWRPTHLWTSLTRATLLGQLVGLRRRTPVVSWQHAAFLKPANRRLLRAMQALSILWIGDSASVARLTHERLGVPEARLAVWPIFRADAEAPVAKPWRPGETIRIGSLGRLHPVKGYDVLIDALAALPAGLPDWEMTIAGDGAAHEALAARAAERGVRGLRLAGYRADAKAWLAGLHLYVQPSRSEGLCVAAHEAITGSPACIASAVGELPYSIADGATGRLVPPGEAAALADALGDLLARPERLAAMGAAARARILDAFAADRFEATGRAIVARLEGRPFDTPSPF